MNSHSTSNTTGAAATSTQNISKRKVSVPTDSRAVLHSTAAGKRRTSQPNTKEFTHTKTQNNTSKQTNVNTNKYSIGKANDEHKPKLLVGGTNLPIQTATREKPKINLALNKQHIYEVETKDRPGSVGGDCVDELAEDHAVDNDSATKEQKVKPIGLSRSSLGTTKSEESDETVLSVATTPTTPGTNSSKSTTNSQIIVIHGVKDPLSTLHAFSFRWGDHTFLCLAQAFVYERAIENGYADLAGEIRKVRNGGQAKAMGSKIYSSLSPEWIAKEPELMERMYREKLEQCSLFRTRLMATNDYLLVNATARPGLDYYWASGLDVENTSKSRGIFPGRNHLGRILMKIRQELYAKEKPCEPISSPQVVSPPVFL